jgi:uncharacterized phiE125 gp8 family phage protein
MIVRVTSGPAKPAYDLTVLKKHVRIDDDTDQLDLLKAYAATAQQHCQDYTRRRLITQTLAMAIDDDWPREWCRRHRSWRRRITLRHPPVQSVTSIVYFDEAGNQQTLAPSQYRIANLHTPIEGCETSPPEAYIEPEYQVTWPTVRRQSGTIVVTYVAGFGLTNKFIPETLQQGIRLLVAHMAENKEAAGANLAELPFAVDAMWLPHRVIY